MKHSKRPEEGRDNRRREFCPKCLQYTDGLPSADMYGSAVRSPMPGWRLYTTTNGTPYTNRGVMVPCSCESGNDAQLGMDRDEAGRERNLPAWYNPEVKKSSVNLNKFIEPNSDF